MQDKRKSDKTEEELQLVRYQLLLHDYQKKQLDKKIPTGFTSIADFIRTLIDGYQDGSLQFSDLYKENQALDRDELEELKKLLDEFKDEIVKEVKLTRSEIRSFQSYEESRKEKNREIIRNNGIKQLKKFWLSDPNIVTIKTRKELEEHIEYEYDFLKPYAFDTIDLLESRGYLELTLSDKIKWNKEMIENERKQEKI